ncbi:hypothetical protein BCR33DRAFT_852374 [Rhizoclosmatium globosum]|uniref:SH3 domain-containing protein n=1 Tax=Rhizoclosmatium globosum TaxID=329046 RepID=A0A1Y2C2Z2_9FUNG|nr:hypothetical protein BCR33DRAFT_852374 [Rhizoclosmatium globosum]|eukprot:ORY41398.1 hypothetical protein BCR33DRAFT_852374 [Rhizoclosmatium globosum]
MDQSGGVPLVSRSVSQPQMRRPKTTTNEAQYYLPSTATATTEPEYLEEQISSSNSRRGLWGSVAGDEAWLRIRDLEDLDDIDSVKEEEEKTLARSKQQQQLYSLYDDHTHLPSKDSIYSLYQSQSQVMPPQRPATYLSDSSTIMRDSPSGAHAGDFFPHRPRTTSHPVDLYKAPPSKIVKANKSYTARTVNEISFSVGDFFFVSSEAHPDFYEVLNPAAKLRGLAPKDHFDSLEKEMQQFEGESQRSRGDNWRNTAPATAKSPYMNDYSPLSPKPMSTTSRPSSNPETMSTKPTRIPPAQNPVNLTPPAHSMNPFTAAMTAIATPVPSNSSPTPTNDSSGDSFVPPPRSGSRRLTAGSSATTPLPPDLRKVHRSVSQPNGFPLPQQSQTTIPPPLPTQQSAQFPYPSTHTDPLIQHLQILSHNPQTKTYKIHITYTTTSTSYIHRTYQDFQTLHLSLLSFYPTESGRTTTTPRRIPFLPSPSQHQPLLQPLLQSYLSILPTLPQKLQNSGVWAKFFSVRRGAGSRDVMDPGWNDHDPSDTFVTLDARIPRTLTITIRSVVKGVDLFRLDVPRDVRYDELVDGVERILGKRVGGLEYLDESGMMVTLHGDEDLGLMVRTWGVLEGYDDIALLV